MRAGEGRHGSGASKEGEARRRMWGNGERGTWLWLGLGVRAQREREGAVGWRRGMTGGPGLSSGERGERRGQPAGPGP